MKNYFWNMTNYRWSKINRLIRSFRNSCRQKYSSRNLHPRPSCIRLVRNVIKVATSIDGSVRLCPVNASRYIHSEKLEFETGTIVRRQRANAYSSFPLADCIIICITVVFGYLLQFRLRWTHRIRAFTTVYPDNWQATGSLIYITFKLRIKTFTRIIWRYH